MTLTEIHSTHDHLYTDIMANYATSFPIYEQRTSQQQAYALSDARYQLLAWHDNGHLSAFMGCWHLSQYIYVEHFAVAQTQRGKGIGSIVLRQFCQEAATPVVLEIDPPTDTTALRRQQFYERIGFHHNSLAHHHPPYRNEYAAHHLHIMSYPHLMTADEHETFCNELSQIVMQQTHQQSTDKS